MAECLEPIVARYAAAHTLQQLDACARAYEASRRTEIRLVAENPAWR